MQTKPYFSSLIAGLVGTALEWYDYALFGFLAPVLAHLFFPRQQAWRSLLLSFMVFAIGFFLRPLGGMIFGSIADRHGRVVALRSTILLISIPSFLIACLPTFALIGWFSTSLLILLRLLQGFSVGGEFAGSMVYLTEIASPRYRALLSGLANNASNIGVLFGVGFCSLLTSIMSPAWFNKIGWRIPFLVGSILGFLAYKLRKIFIESRLFLEVQAQNKLQIQPLRYLIHTNWRLLILGIFLCAMGACGIYTLTVYLDTYLIVVKSYSLNSALTLQSLLLILTLILVPIASLISNYVSPIKLLKIAVIGNMLFAILIFAYLPKNHIIVVGWLLIPLIIFISIEQGIMPSVLTSLFPTEVRYSGVSISYNISYAYIGGATPMYLTALINKFHYVAIPGFCLAFAALITGFALLKLFPQPYFSRATSFQNA